jgi:hypothetical protein
VGKSEGKRPLRRRRHRWWEEVILRWILRKYYGVEQIGLICLGMRTIALLNTGFHKMPGNPENVGDLRLFKKAKAPWVS